MTAYIIGAALASGSVSFMIGWSVGWQHCFNAVTHE